MPVVTLQTDRLLRLLGGRPEMERVIERIPYLGLDIEEVGDTFLKLEYNPNRPDYSTDYGIARGLKGILGLELGAPKYEVELPAFDMEVDESVAGVRPLVMAAIAKGGRMDDEDIRQLIAMQEDLHMGIGRRRRKMAIGIHNLDSITPPLRYHAVEPSLAFIPLGESKAMSIQQIVRELETGKEYGDIVGWYGRYPIITDARGEAISLPPIINAELTRVTSSTRNLFIEVTGTDARAIKEALAIFCSTLSDMGFRLQGVRIRYGDREEITPDMSPLHMPLDLEYANRLLGLDLGFEEAKECLARSRIDLTIEGGSLIASIPPYRIDLLHPVDLVEELAIGYGLDKFEPLLPSNYIPGSFSLLQTKLAGIREALLGLGLMEVMNLSLVGPSLLYELPLRPKERALEVRDPKSLEHSVLRDALLPSLLHTIARNVREPYPQRIFELGKVFKEGGEGVEERYHLGVVIAHSSANYTEAKSILEALLKVECALQPSFKAADERPFTKGRCAAILVKGEMVGHLGEVDPEVLNNWRIRVPVAGFELDLSFLLKEGEKA